MIDSFSTVPSAVALVVTLIVIYEGTRMLARNRRANRSSVALLALGALLAAGQAITAYYMLANATTLKAVTQVRPIPSPLSTELQALQPQDREHNSRMLARARFVETGELGSHYRADGTTMAFAPTEQDIQDRELSAGVQACIAGTSSKLQLSALLSLTLLLSCAAIGLSVGGTQRRKYGPLREGVA